MKPPNKNIFALEPSLEQNFVPNGILIGFEMADKQIGVQTDGQTDIFVFIIVEILFA